MQSEGLVSAIDLCVGLGWVAPPTVDNWRQGRFASFEDTLPVDGAKVADALDHLRRWAQEKGLTPEDVSPLSSSRDHHQLRYCKNGDPAAEQVWATSWVVSLPGWADRAAPRADRCHTGTKRTPGAVFRLLRAWRSGNPERHARNSSPGPS